jgi:hypothetical protein
LSAYLQAAAMQAEHLCREVEAHTSSLPPKSKRRKKAPVAPEHEIETTPDDGADPLTAHPALQAAMEETFGFKPTTRTITYILKRFDKLGYARRSKRFFQKMFTMSRLKEFRTIYQEVLGRDPFKAIKDRNIDTINAVNFALFDEIEGAKVAKEGLRSTLKWRKDRSSS